MANTRIEVSRQLQNNLIRLPDRFKKAIKGAIIRSALADVENPAKRNCRVDTGRLRASIHTEYTRDYSNRENLSHRYTSFAVGRIERMQTRNNQKTNWVGKIHTHIGPLDVVVGTDVHYARKIERLDGFLISAYEGSKIPMRNEIQRAIRRMIQRR